MGPTWIDNIFYGVEMVKDVSQSSDVYHATQYLDTVMRAPGRDEDLRTRHRREWLRGHVSARDWLAHHLPKPEVWPRRDDKARTALKCLETRLDSTD